jgi:hypothetical protein
MYLKVVSDFMYEINHSMYAIFAGTIRSNAESRNAHASYHARTGNARQLEAVFSRRLRNRRSSEQVVNSLECGGPAPLWSAETNRRIVESNQSGVAATGRDRPKRCQASALQRVVSHPLDQRFISNDDYRKDLWHPFKNRHRLRRNVFETLTLALPYFLDQQMNLFLLLP